MELCCRKCRASYTALEHRVEHDLTLYGRANPFCVDGKSAHEFTEEVLPEERIATNQSPHLVQ